jgi:hypothetical protein
VQLCNYIVPCSQPHPVKFTAGKKNGSAENATESLGERTDRLRPSGHLIRARGSPVFSRVLNNEKKPVELLKGRNLLKTQISKQFPCT